MFDYLKLKYEWDAYRTQCKFDKQRSKLEAANAPHGELMKLNAEEYAAISRAEKILDIHAGIKVLFEAREFDVEMPARSEQPQMWTTAPGEGAYWLSSKGRASVRKLIYEEQARQLEIRTKRFNVYTPVITAATGLAGVLLGIIALLHKK